MGVCITTLPVTYCTDPADSRVRERIREGWNKEYLEHEKQAAEREVVKARWEWEDEQHAALLHEWEKEYVQHSVLLRKWEQEGVQHAALLHEWEQEHVQHERELKERAQREKEERMRLDLFWGHVETHQCKTYGTREYSAVLMNLPINWERRIEACKATPLEIHGTTHMPKSCEDKVCDIHWRMWG